MKAVVITEFVDVSETNTELLVVSILTKLQTLDNVIVSDIPSPEPQDGFLIKVHAAGVNFVDTLYVRLLAVIS